MSTNDNDAPDERQLRYYFDKSGSWFEMDTPTTSMVYGHKQTGQAVEIPEHPSHKQIEVAVSTIADAQNSTPEIVNEAIRILYENREPGESEIGEEYPDVDETVDRLERALDPDESVLLQGSDLRTTARLLRELHERVFELESAITNYHELLSMSDVYDDVPETAQNVLADVMNDALESGDESDDQQLADKDHDTALRDYLTRRDVWSRHLTPDQSDYETLWKHASKERVVRLPDRPRVEHVVDTIQSIANAEDVRKSVICVRCGINDELFDRVVDDESDDEDRAVLISEVRAAATQGPMTASEAERVRSALDELRERRKQVAHLKARVDESNNLVTLREHVWDQAEKAWDETPSREKYNAEDVVSLLSNQAEKRVRNASDDEPDDEPEPGERDIERTIEDYKAAKHLRRRFGTTGFDTPHEMREEFDREVTYPAAKELLRVLSLDDREHLSLINSAADIVDNHEED